MNAQPSPDLASILRGANEMSGPFAYASGENSVAEAYGSGTGFSCGNDGGKAIASNDYGQESSSKDDYGRQRSTSSCKEQWRV